VDPLGARGAEGIHIVVARGPGASLDCGATLKKLAAAAGGRGGGSPDRAEGKLPAGAELVSLVAATL
jgi:alanyl-tRNA synthetase